MERITIEYIRFIKEINLASVSGGEVALEATARDTTSSLFSNNIAILQEGVNFFRKEIFNRKLL